MFEMIALGVADEQDAPLSSFMIAEGSEHAPRTIRSACSDAFPSAVASSERSGERSSRLSKIQDVSHDAVLEVRQAPRVDQGTGDGTLLDHSIVLFGSKHEQQRSAQQRSVAVGGARARVRGA